MRRILVILLCLVFTGCATMPPKLNKPFENTRVFNASFDTVWNSIMQIINKGELITFSDKNNGYISFEKNILVDEVREIALAPRGVAWRSATTTLSFIVNQVEKENTSVIINSKIIGHGSGGLNAIFGTAATPAQLIEMGSRGVLEKEYLDKIESLINNE